MAKIVVAGAGYVGLVTGACLAELGHDITGIEIDPKRLSALRVGRLPVHEPGLDELVATKRAAGRLRFTGSYAEAFRGAEFAFVAVNTPPSSDGSADTSFVYRAVRSILEHAEEGLIIVMKSTVPVGTGDEVKKLVIDSGKRVKVVSNPEFLRQGSAVEDFLHPDRIVVGGSPAGAVQAVADLYTGLGAPVLMCSHRSAELAKYAANTLLASRISFMNEVSAISEAVNANVDDVAQIIGADKRIGPSFLKAGLGWGGSCFPKDVLALIHTAVSHGFRPALLRSIYDVNIQQRKRALEKVLSSLDGAPGPTVGVLGLAFKTNTDDVRGSPALDIIKQLLSHEIRVRAHDPLAIANARSEIPRIEYCDEPYGVVEGSDVVLLATEWPVYVSLDWERVLSLMRGRTVVDGRNVLDGRTLTLLGFDYLSFGNSPNGTDADDLWTAERAS